MGQTGDETIEVKEVTMMDKKGIDLMIPVLINGVKINATADTGSQISIISNDFAKKLNPQLHLEILSPWQELVVEVTSLLGQEV